MDFKYLEPDLNELVTKKYNGLQNAKLIRVGTNGYLLKEKYSVHAESIRNMPIKKTDVCVMTMPRSGTTLIQELVWLVMNNLDFEKAKSIYLTERYIFVEQFTLYSDIPDDLKVPDEVLDKLQVLISGVEMLASAPSPRFIKTHLAFSLLPPSLIETAKVVYIARDPRDVAVSFYHHSKLFVQAGFNGDFKDFWKLFMNDLVVFTPFFKHVKEAWDKRNHPNMLFLFYEETIKDMPGTIQRICEFFDKNYTAEQMDLLCEHISIKNFKNNKSVNFDQFKNMNILSEKEQFIRNGGSGGWRSYFDEEMTEQAEKWIANNLKGTDFRYPHLKSEMI